MLRRIQESLSHAYCLAVSHIGAVGLWLGSGEATASPGVAAEISAGVSGDRSSPRGERHSRTGQDEAAAAELAISAVEKLKRAIGIPERIRDIGGREEQLPRFAAKAFAIKRLMMVNPRQPTEADLLGILREAF